MENDWTLKEFTISKIYTMIEVEQTIEVPQYQRGIVWSDNQIKDLIDSIKKGLPFGSILLFERSSDHYMIIDGLQRTSSIYQFVKEPGKFFEENDIDRDVILEIINRTSLEGNRDELVNDVTNELKKWVNTNKTMQEISDLQYVEFGVVLSRKYESLSGKEIEIGSIIAPILKEYKEVCNNILAKRVPAIVMKGTGDYLPEVFDRINSKGTNLSKYDIYSASWGEDKYEIKKTIPKEIIEANRDRYDNMLCGEMQLADYDSSDFMRRKELTLFEIAFGFGKYISNKWPNLFGESKDPKTMTGIGFNLINACLCNPNHKLGSMNRIFKEKISSENLPVFLNKILECIEDIDACIGPINKFKGNSQRTSPYKPKHSDFQILSIILTVFINKYVRFTQNHDGRNLDFSYDFVNENEYWRRNNQLFFDNVIKIYLIEIVNGRWSGTGDKKLDLILENPQYYFRNVQRSEFEEALTTWNNKVNNERLELSRVASPKEQELALLAAIYIHTFSANQNLNDSTYDIEHLATKKLMKTKLERFNGQLKLPISSFGNICYLPSIINRQKKDKTLYQDDGYLRTIDITDVENKYSFTERNDFDFLDDNSLNAEEFKNAYFEFINKRFNRMLKKIGDFYFG